MKYMGSKSRIAKYIVPIIQEMIEKNNIKIYIEPFCGGCNIIDKIKCETRIASDKQHYLIELFKNYKKIENLPDFITKEHYSEVRNSYNTQNKQFEDWYIGAIGFLASYNGRFFDGGYAGIIKTKDGNIRNYYDEAKRNILEQNIDGIIFKEADYLELEIPKNSLIYCDIPYKDTKQYGVSKNFNHNEFWKWVKEISKENIVIVSEENAPEYVSCIWEQPIKRTIDNNKRLDKVEKLFKI
jgi:DNA adenine methylase